VVARARSIDSITDALDDQTAVVEHLLNALSAARQRAENAGSGPHGAAPAVAGLESAEHLVGIGWETLKLALDVLRDERPALDEGELRALVETNRILVRNRR
jgi:hypothetical protein